MRSRSGFVVMVKLVGLVKPLAGFMLLAICMGCLGHLLATSLTVLAGVGVLKVVGENMGMSYAAIFICILLFALIRGILRYGEQACNHFIAFKLLALIRDKVFAALRKLCPAKLEGRDKGDLITIITTDIELLEVFYAHTISPIVIAIVYGIVIILFAGQFHPLLGMVVLISHFVVGCVIPLVISRLSKDMGMEFRSGSGEMGSFVLDSLRGLSEILQYNCGMERLRKMNQRSEKLSETEERMRQLTSRNTAITNTAILLMDLFMLFAATVLLLQGKIAIYGLLLSVLALMGSFGPTVALANLGSTLQNTFAAGNRVLDILEEEPPVPDIVGKKDISFAGASAENVTFGYGEETILEEASVVLPVGKIVGITGKSGSGKSTLLKLFMRFWEVEQGSVCVSGTDVSEINTVSLRNAEGFMTQDTHLFHDSIRNNLLLANPSASREEMETACRKASIHDFIMSLPQGYDTPIGELGDTLSGGERQRLGLARVFLHDAPFVLLDEPTSNLDSLNEAVILKSLKETADGKTILLVSHRESTMRIADEVYSMSEISKKERIS